MFHKFKNQMTIKFNIVYHNICYLKLKKYFDDIIQQTRLQWVSTIEITVTSELIIKNV